MISVGFGGDWQTQGKPAVTGVTCKDDLFPYAWKTNQFVAGAYQQTYDDDILFPSNKGLVPTGGAGIAKMHCTAWPLW